MSEISHLSATDKDTIDAWATVIKTLYLIIGGIIGGVLSYWWNRKKYLLAKQKLEHEIELSRNKIEDDKKALRQQMITNNIAPMRQAWINDVRERTSNFIHQSKVLRMILFSTLLNKSNLNKDEIIDRERNASTIYYQLNESAQYLDVILPYSIDGDRDEPEADKLRINIINIIDTFDSLFKDIDSKNLDNIDKYLNEILSITNLASKNTKDILLKEWRETKSLKEIE
ncbi:hypothetical protein O9368_01440 [Proteus mirabilis]|uniref:hypothetical protein n=1 Tax=Proteus mirabilis TaxID=584 RepID=UPI0025750088|nr:hypothetical protein [Proteus mirabilis]MDM3686252.1 hypothetical protein [Proteus mirabilis]